MKIYLICPVRLAKEEDTKRIERYVEQLEKQGHQVFYPRRDADQNCDTGWKIVQAEIEAIWESDEIHVIWDVESKGSHFDLGVAMALNKLIKIVYLIHPDTSGKSYVKVMKAYETAHMPFSRNLEARGVEMSISRIPDTDFYLIKPSFLCCNLIQDLSSDDDNMEQPYVLCRGTVSGEKVTRVKWIMSFLWFEDINLEQVKTVKQFIENITSTERHDFVY